MPKPPYGRIASTAKHGTDADLLAMRDEIRWLGRWTDDIHTELQYIWKCAEVSIAPLSPADDTRQVTIRLVLGASQVETLLHLLDEGDE